MTLRTLLAAIATGLVITLAVTSTSAGTDGKTTQQKQGWRASKLKQGDTEQGTFAYRFDTYTNYSSCTSSTCTSSMNNTMQSGSTAYVPPGGQTVKKQDMKQKPTEIKKSETPTND